MRPDGYYWVRTIQFGSSSVLLCRGTDWRDGHAPSRLRIPFP